MVVSGSKGTVPLSVCISFCVSLKCLIRVSGTWARGYKTFFMLNSVEHKILIAHKYENIKKFNIFQAQISVECYFSCS